MHSAGPENALFVSPCCGIDVYVHAFLPYYAIYRIFGGVAAYSHSNAVGWILLFNTISVSLLFVTVLIHEFGHSFMAIYLGGSVPKILLWPFGGLAYCTFDTSIKNQLMVSSAGPATHLPMFAVWAALFFFTKDCTADFNIFTPPTLNFYTGECLWTAVCLDAVKTQVFLFLFNVFLPIYPLDGGKIFICCLACCCNCHIKTLAWICVSVSSLLGAGLAAYCIWSQNWFGGFLCLWLLYQVYKIYSHIQAGTLSSHPQFEQMPGGRLNPTATRDRDNMGAFHRIDDAC